MPEAAHGMFGSRYEGQPMTAKTYHVYQDCGGINRIPMTTAAGTRLLPVVETLDDREVQLLGLNLCKICDRRARRKTAEDLVHDVVVGWSSVLGEADVETIVDRAVEALAENGFLVLGADR